MRVNVGPIAQDKGKSLEVDLSTPGQPFEVGGERVVFMAPVAVKARITNTGRCLVVTGGIRTTVELTCHRCLERFGLDLDVPFEVEFFRKGGGPVADELGSKQRALVKDATVDGEEAFLAENGVLFTGDEIDLTETVREEVTVAIPIKWLCREDCHGLCPVCGSNRNLKDCGCTVENLDPRFAALEKLLDPNRS